MEPLNTTIRFDGDAAEAWFLLSFKRWTNGDRQVLGLNSTSHFILNCRRRFGRRA